MVETVGCLKHGPGLPNNIRCLWMSSTEDEEKSSNDTNSTLCTDDRHSAGSGGEAKLTDSDCVQQMKLTSDPILASVERVIFNKSFNQNKLLYKNSSTIIKISIIFPTESRRKCSRVFGFVEYSTEKWENRY